MSWKKHLREHSVEYICDSFYAQVESEQTNGYIFCPKSLGLHDFWIIKKVCKMRKETFSANNSFNVQV